MQRPRMSADRTQHRAVLVLLLLCCLAGGCVGVGPTGTMTFDRLEHPASLSAFLYGPDHRVVSLERGLRKVGTFSEGMSCWSILYSHLPFGECADTEAIALRINDAIDAAGGDGMVNVTISGKPGIVSWLHPLTLLPFWPTNTRARITGDIVKFDPEGGPRRPAPKPVDNVLDVRIRQPRLDEVEGLRLAEECEQRGRLETVFVGRPLRGGTTGILSRTWEKNVPAEIANGTEAIDEFDMMLHLREKGHARGANVVQVLYWTSLGNEVAALHERIPHAPSLEQLRYPVALQLLYWNCPSPPPQPAVP